MKVLMSAVALCLAIVSPASAQDLGRNQDTWTWDGRVESGKWFRLSSVNGPVTIEPSPDNMVHVRAEKDVRDGEITDVAFQVIQSGGDVRICALWRGNYCDEEGHHSRRNDDDDDRDRRGRRNNVKVNFTVRVPAGVRVSAGTVNGEMRIRNLTSDVRANTVNGRVEVSNVGGDVRALYARAGARAHAPLLPAPGAFQRDVCVCSRRRDADARWLSQKERELVGASG